MEAFSSVPHMADRVWTGTVESPYHTCGWRRFGWEQHPWSDRQTMTIVHRTSTTATRGFAAAYALVTMGSAWYSLCIVCTALLLLVQAVSAETTPSPSIILSFQADDSTQTPASPHVATTPETDSTTVPVPTRTPAAPVTTTPALANRMRNILRKVGSIPCVEPTRSRMFALLYGSNIRLHDTCITDTGYQYFPYTGELPTTTQIVAAVKSTACMQIYAGVVLARFPECDVDFVSVRSSAEIYYRIKADLDADRVPPTQAQFYELYNLNRVVNLLHENASLIDEVFRDSPTSAAVSLSEMTRWMNPIERLPGVALGANMTIVVTPTESTETETTAKTSSQSGNGAPLRQAAIVTATPTNTQSPLANGTSLLSDARARTHVTGRCGGIVVVVVGIAMLV